MGVVGEAGQERTGAAGDGVDDFLTGDHGPECGVAAGEPLGGDEDIRPGLSAFREPMLDGEVAAGAAHPGHDLVSDEQYAVAVTDFRDAWQISRRRNDGAECRSADRLKDEGG